MNIKSLRIAWVSMFMSFGALLQAQEPDTTNIAKQISLDEVVVTGTGTRHTVDTAPVRTEIITRAQIDALQGRTAEDILSMLSPAFDFSPTEMGSGITLNGFGNKYILILVDGKRLHGDMGGQNDLGKIPTESIRRIEIVKGASSSLYGSDAMAGVINIITNRNTAPLRVQNSSRVGSYADVQQFNLLGLTGSRWSSETSLSFRHSDGWKNTHQEWFKRKVIDNSVTKTANRYSNFTLSQRLEYDFNARWTVYASAEGYGKEMRRPMGEPQWSNYDMRYRTYGVRTGVKFTQGEKAVHTLDFSYDLNNYYHLFKVFTEEEYVQEDGTLIHPIYNNGDVTLQNKQQRFTAQYKSVFELPGNRLSVGAEYMQDWLNAPFRIRTSMVNAFTAAVYAQDEWSIGKRFFLTPGIRVVHHKEFGLDFSPKVTALYRIGHWSLGGTYSQGFKAPGLKELYYHYERYMAAKLRIYMGNRQLKPEHSHYFSLSTDFKGKQFKFSVGGYYNAIRNMIALVEVPREKLDYARGIDKRMQYMNMEEAVSRGVDVEASYRFNRYWSAGAAYSFLYADGYFINEDNERVHHLLDGSVRHRGTCRLIWIGREMDVYGRSYTPGASLFGRIQSKKYSYNYGDADGYMIWRIDTSHRVRHSKKFDLTAHAGIDNLLDYKETKPYGLPYATTTPGRTFYVSVAFNFNRW